ncbi:hypothetical protein [Streptomyces sp. NPDC002913]
MTWHDLRDTEHRHEGYALGVLADGTTPTYRVRDALHERRFTDDPYEPGGTWSGPARGRPEQPPAQLLPACSCGWRGMSLPYEPDPRIDPDLGVWDLTGARARTQWEYRHVQVVSSNSIPEDHAERLTELDTALRELADEYPRAALAMVRQLRETIDRRELQAVANGRVLDIPWAQLGSDLGQTRQSINARYTNPSQSRAQTYGAADFDALVEQYRTRQPGTPPPEPGAPENPATAAEKVISRARENHGSAESFDRHVGAVGIEPYGELHNAARQIANEHLPPVNTETSETELTDRTTRARQLWEKILPDLEEYAARCRTTGHRSDHT